MQAVEFVRIVVGKPQLPPVVSSYVMVKEMGEPSTESDSEN